MRSRNAPMPICKYQQKKNVLFDDKRFFFVIIIIFMFVVKIIADIKISTTLHVHNSRVSERHSTFTKINSVFVSMFLLTS